MSFINLSVVVLFVSSAFYVEAFAQSDEEDFIAPSWCVDGSYEDSDVEDRVKIKACDWLKTDEKGRKTLERANNDNNDLFIGVALSKFSPHKEPGSWASERPLTYYQAYLDVSTEFAIQESGQDIESEVEKRGFRQRGIAPEDLECYPDEKESTWYERIVKKSVVLFEGKLDKALDELDVDPVDFIGSRERRLARRVGEFVSALEKSTGRAVKPTRISGLMIIKTFEEIEGGDAAIGILARYSGDISDITRKMASNNGNLPKDYPRSHSGKNVNQLINNYKSTKSIGKTFGVRIHRDENGYPLLLAFGHSAKRYFGADKQKQKDDKRFALDLSEEEAYSQLAEYVDATLTFSRTTNKEFSSFTGYNLFDESGKCISEEDRKLSLKEKINEKWVTRARLDGFKGATRKYKSMIKHPVIENVDIAVSIIAWSPEISTKPSTVSEEIKESGVVEEKSGSSSSPVLSDPNDF